MIVDVVCEFFKYEYIIVLRFYVYILVMFMDILNMVIDNFYGKNSWYFSDWISLFVNVCFLV